MRSRASGFRVPLEDTYYCYHLRHRHYQLEQTRRVPLRHCSPSQKNKNKKKKKKTLKRSPPNITNKEREENTLKITLALFQRSSPHPSSHPRPATHPPILPSFCIPSALCLPFFCLSIKCSLLLSRPLFLVPPHSIFLRDTLCPHPLSLAAII